MVDFYGHRSRETFTYKRVRWSTFADRDEEVAEYTQFVDGGDIEYGAYTNLKVSGSFEFVGEAPDTTDLLRVYYRFTDEHGETSPDYALGTFIVGYTERQNRQGGGGLIQEGTVTASSLLKPLSDRLCGLPLTIPAGTDPVAYAEALAASLGLRVNCYRPTSYALAGPHTFEPNDSWLTVVNWCLTNNSTQYQAAYVDGYGVIQMQPYVPPTERTPSAVFRDDERSIMAPEVVEANDWQDAENTVRLYYEDELCAMWASAVNVSGARTSLDARGGRERTYFERLDECTSLDALKATALTRLMDRASEIERVTLTHAWLPLDTGDTVAIEYSGTAWTGSVQNMHVDLIPSVPCQTQIRRAVPASIDVEVDGAVLWSAE